MSTVMLALSIQQPWAWLIAAGHKDVENRSWKTMHRGPVLIHAGQKFDAAGWAWVKAEFPQIKLPEIGDYDLGGIVGEARIVDCVRAHPSPWFQGDVGFVLEGGRHLPFARVRGQLRLFAVVRP